MPVTETEVKKRLERLVKKVNKIERRFNNGTLPANEGRDVIKMFIDGLKRVFKEVEKGTIYRSKVAGKVESQYLCKKMKGSLYKHLTSNYVDYSLGIYRTENCFVDGKLKSGSNLKKFKHCNHTLYFALANFISKSAKEPVYIAVSPFVFKNNIRSSDNMIFISDEDLHLIVLDFDFKRKVDGKSVFDLDKFLLFMDRIELLVCDILSHNPFAIQQSRSNLGFRIIIPLAKKSSNQAILLKLLNRLNKLSEFLLSDGSVFDNARFFFSSNHSITYFKTKDKFMTIKSFYELINKTQRKVGVGKYNENPKILKIIDKNKFFIKDEKYNNNTIKNKKNNNIDIEEKIKYILNEAKILINKSNGYKHLKTIVDRIEREKDKNGVYNIKDVNLLKQAIYITKHTEHTLKNIGVSKYPDLNTINQISKNKYDVVESNIDVINKFGIIPSFYYCCSEVSHSNFEASRIRKSKRFINSKNTNKDKVVETLNTILSFIEKCDIESKRKLRNQLGDGLIGIENLLILFAYVIDKSGWFVLGRSKNGRYFRLSISSDEETIGNIFVYYNKPFTIFFQSDHSKYRLPEFIRDRTKLSINGRDYLPISYLPKIIELSLKSYGIELFEGFADRLIEIFGFDYFGLDALEYYSTIVLKMISDCYYKNGETVMIHSYVRSVASRDLALVRHILEVIVNYILRISSNSIKIVEENNSIGIRMDFFMIEALSYIENGDFEEIKNLLHSSYIGDRKIFCAIREVSEIFLFLCSFHIKRGYTSEFKIARIKDIMGYSKLLSNVVKYFGGINKFIKSIENYKIKNEYIYKDLYKLNNSIRIERLNKKRMKLLNIA